MNILIQTRDLVSFYLKAMFTLLILVPSTSTANIPAAYLACEGAEEREPCALPGPQYGVCITDTLCEDPPETIVNECVICVDSCWASPDGTSCIRPWTGELGVCESQDRCTDKPETSFEECRRCVEGQAWADSSSPREMSNNELLGCQQDLNYVSSSTIKTTWYVVLLCFMLIFRFFKRKKIKINN